MAIARLFTFSEPQARISPPSLRFLLLRCFEVLLFCLLVCPHGTPRCVPLANNGINKREEKGKERKETKRNGRKRKERKAHPCFDSFYLSALSSSGSSLNLPHPHSSLPSLSSVRCNSHCRVATPVLWMKSCSTVTPLWVNRRECSVVSLVIPACRLSSWYSLQPKSRCLTFWTLSEHWHCVESYDGRHIKKDLKYPCPSRNW